ncbi:ABC-type Mn2+/Zn2+ transport system, permease component [Phaeobacter gallaeciensis]|uniref:ABC-type Mn2+/Zn2+ transport system, permease component n=1 Tax=Phaeobacter gallaeciensis TaxID=60890 RepID=A0A1B0ZRU3_9RHOB|nr:MULTISPECIES: metal ABC transporter permease [Phaeobacter]MDF1773281.1 metal ABC transporter permease [Pseudophaeobacter sp. bin_em_oilr2.035]MEE2635441.1 metal ABC transporter permease [Pseudomonadota bacterium]ANP36896.1 ABC-type Mn2+/Zn2+ transport system, permease component [Phaeobacter gallaeciensis]MDE4060986.1 metal ABC transporter permease [Phaeobacter gallaeciensis]MDE4124005.1 metal ABC transporter permease [Phaeobacter gallaeciensis]
MMGSEFVPLSLTPLLIGTFAAVACALPGNFLLLRRQALIGDAISHVVLPGIVVAFLLTGAIAAGPMLLGAAGAAVTAVILIEAVRRLGRIEPGAAMGVIFTTMFAAGVLLLEQTDTSTVHLDVEHALYGNLESLIWLDATGWSSLWDAEALRYLPPELPRMGLTLLGVVAFIALFWRALKISTFDEGFARTLGIRTNLLGLALVITAAVAAVAAFDAVGSIIVIAMFICPPAAARMMTNRLEAQIGWSVVFAVLSAVLGYVLAGYGPLWLGGTDAVSAAGMIAAVSGMILAVTARFGPCRRRAGAPAGG